MQTRLCFKSACISMCAHHLDPLHIRTNRLHFFFIFISALSFSRFHFFPHILASSLRHIFPSQVIIFIFHFHVQSPSLLPFLPHILTFLFFFFLGNTERSKIWIYFPVLQVLLFSILGTFTRASVYDFFIISKQCGHTATSVNVTAGIRRCIYGIRYSPIKFSAQNGSGDMLS